MKQKEPKKTKFKKCPKCGTETVLAICNYCHTPLTTIKVDRVEENDLKTGDSASDKRRLRRLARKENAKKEK